MMFTQDLRVLSLASLVVATLATSCGPDSPVAEPSLPSKQAKHDFADFLEMTLAAKVVEPSGLTAHGQYLYAVSDPKKGLIHQLTKSGELVKSFDPRSGDFEGITTSGSEFFVVRESVHSIDVYDLNFRLKRNIDIHAIAQKYSITGNSGFEGIMYFGGALYVTTEKNPQLLIKIGERGEEAAVWDLGSLGLLDISDITYDPQTSSVWIVSHESKALVRMNAAQLASPRTLKADYSVKISTLIGKAPKQAEGIAVDESYMYLVSDEDQKFYRFKKPTE